MVKFNLFELTYHKLNLKIKQLNLYHICNKADHFFIMHLL